MMRMSMIAMSRTGHTAIMRWFMERRGIERPIEELNHSFEDSIAACPGGPLVLVLRSYPNWAASVVVKYVKHDEAKLRDYAMYWISHAAAAFTVPTILYEQWVVAGFGKEIKGGPSSFGNGSVLTRYKQVRDNERWRWMMEFDDALEHSNRLFGRMEEA